VTLNLQYKYRKVISFHSFHCIAFVFFSFVCLLFFLLSFLPSFLPSSLPPFLPSSFLSSFFPFSLSSFLSFFSLSDSYFVGLCNIVCIVLTSHLDMGTIVQRKSCVRKVRVSTSSCSTFTLYLQFVD
jgi:hypothetical protein